MLRQWSCSATYAKGDASEFAGDQTLVTVELLGLKRRALLDSGSQISILPLEVLLTVTLKKYLNYNILPFTMRQEIA
ncbi:hypothetical protein Y032_0519g2840 [Ancylostoma ceylanicum]|uniref:Uncharacterized protein n=1 Tax=Ancylostoma ceylanicum TaxID=53326 RepID=A0A016WT42_9BILA|nr:hypothetical protein Y032_0519g2840 [Ancylostoma ceylanicum]